MPQMNISSKERNLFLLFGNSFSDPFEIWRISVFNLKQRKTQTDVQFQCDSKTAKDKLKIEKQPAIIAPLHCSLAHFKLNAHCPGK